MDGTNDETCWAAVANRRPIVGKAFVYAVRSTGIYCLPGCPSPTPLRRNARFFGTGAEAEGAGYRACKRCRPGIGS